MIYWSEDALSCYKIQQDCSQCQLMQFGYDELTPKTCQMPKAIAKLLRIHGEPQFLPNGSLRRYQYDQKKTLAD